MRNLAAGIGGALMFASSGCAEMNQALNSAVSAAAAAPVNLVANGSFEETVVAAGRYQLFSTGQAFPGWQVIGAKGNVAPISGQYTKARIQFVARHGNQWLDMTGLSNSATGVQQSVSTQAGAPYTLTFYVGNVVASGFGTTSAVEVLVNGKSAGTFRNDGNSSGLQNWRQAQLAIPAAGASTTIAFINRDASNDNSCGLDDVSLVRNPPAATN